MPQKFSFLVFITYAKMKGIENMFYLKTFNAGRWESGFFTWVVRVEPANITADLLAMAARRVHFFLRRSLDLTFYRSRQPLLKNLNIRLLSDQVVDRLGSEPPIPEYKSPQNESLDRRRARLLYQSR